MYILVIKFACGILRNRPTAAENQVEDTGLDAYTPATSTRK